MEGNKKTGRRASDLKTDRASPCVTFEMNIPDLALRSHGGRVVRTTVSPQEGYQFEPRPGKAFLCRVCMLSPCLCGVLWVLWSPPTFQSRSGKSVTLD